MNSRGFNHSNKFSQAIQHHQNLRQKICAKELSEILDIDLSRNSPNRPDHLNAQNTNTYFVHLLCKLQNDVQKVELFNLYNQFLVFIQNNKEELESGKYIQPPSFTTQKNEADKESTEFVNIPVEKILSEKEKREEIQSLKTQQKSVIRSCIRILVILILFVIYDFL
ncbi:hypothetical protein TRFO_05063 [Tritrichomonas foetus]|uniref:Uncharacterized protein n=1 Tax=Tritrichomonas foetus TaxID=1144522 RepID=A0A1J4KE90_9EUKA|nr:hypothetical protein TRFO_05063 [Tritrichomonas foetus]|eukprot:OHT07942.1 hypothetical protein TRFO_05063 [Tritrichomonas foetus]